MDRGSDVAQDGQAGGAAETDEAPAAGAKKRGGLALVLMVVAALAAGGAAGVFLIGPAVASAAGGDGEAEKASGHGEEPAADGHGGGGGEAGTVWSLDNLIVNPAGTQGMRFLVVSMAVHVRDEATVEALRAREPEVRDALLDMLAVRTVDQLADPTTRSDLREEILSVLESLAGPGSVQRVFLPQFVLQ